MYEMPRSAFSTPVDCEFPCPITTERFTPSRKEPPYSSGSTVSLTSITLGRLEYDVTREAVRYEHVSHPATYVATLHVPHKADPRLVHETVGLFDEVVALPRLLADVDEPDPRLSIQPEVATCEHTAQNSEIQEILRPAGDGGPGVE